MTYFNIPYLLIEGQKMVKSNLLNILGGWEGWNTWERNRNSVIWGQHKRKEWFSGEFRNGTYYISNNWERHQVYDRYGVDNISIATFC